MTILIATTQWRYASITQSSGHIYMIDVERRQVTARSRMIDPKRPDDPNPRGGMRGARGIGVDGNRVWVANYNTVYQFDPTWRIVNTITHPSCAHIHDILIYQNNLWVTSTVNDTLFEFSQQGQLISHLHLRKFSEVNRLTGWGTAAALSDDDILSGRIDFRQQQLTRDQRYDRLHVNSLCFLPNGDAVICLGLLNNFLYTFVHDFKSRLQRHGLWQHIVAGNQAMIRGLRLKPRHNTQLVVNAPVGRSALIRWNRCQNSFLTLATINSVHAPIHNLLHDDSDGTVLFNQTNTGEIIRFNPHTGETLAKLLVSDKFLRGIAWIQNGLVAVGARQEVLLANMGQREVVSRIQLTENPDEYVFAIATLPEGFSAIPDTLSSF